MTAIVADEIFSKHYTGYGHPECPERYNVIRDAFMMECSEIPIIKPRVALSEELLLCHSSSYLDLLQKEIHDLANDNCAKASIALSTGDAQICSDSFDVAVSAVGGVLKAIDAVMNKDFRNAFCLVRPPGHHATRELGMGFCLLNNVAIGARYIQTKYGLPKVLIVDWDVHHGNGTQDIFYADPSIFYFSTHQSPFYPGTGLVNERGLSKGFGSTLNCPILAGQNSRKQVLEAFRDQLTPAMERFQPDFILISAGFDAHIDDPLGGFNLIEEDFIALTMFVKKIARKFSNERIVSVLEGGYNLQALASSTLAHVKALMAP